MFFCCFFLFIFFSNTSIDSRSCSHYFSKNTCELAYAKATHIFFFSKNMSICAVFNDQIFNNILTNDIVSFEQLSPIQGGLVRQRCRGSCHRGVQLILAYSWVRPAILAAGKGRGGMFLFLLFLHCHSFSFLPCPSLSSPLLSLLSLFSLSLGDQHKMIHKGWSVVKP